MSRECKALSPNLDKPEPNKNSTQRLKGAKTQRFLREFDEFIEFNEFKSSTHPTH
jgi:hypothetical protein